jgi:hypothetical protein
MVQIRQAIYIITPLPHPITASSPAYVLGERPRRAATLATPPPWWGCRIWPLLPSGRCVEDRSGGWRPAPSPCLPPHPTSSSSMSRRCGSLPRPRQAPPHMGGGSGAASPTLWTARGGRILRMAADTVTSAAPRPTSSLTRHGGCRQRRPPPLPPRLRVSSPTMRPSWCGARPASPMWLHLAKGVWLGVGMGGRQDCI